MARTVLVPLAVAARAPALGAVVHEFAGRTMGTTWQVRLAGPRGLARDPLAQGIQARLDEVVAQMSPWEPASDLRRFNDAPAGSWHAPPAPFMAVLSHGLGVAQASGGAFDPTAGALVEAWGFGPRDAAAPRTVPDAAAIARARTRGGWQRLQLDASGRRVRQPGGLALDFSGIAKGYAVDRIAGWLDERGFDAHLVEVGGELRGSGVRPDGQPWWVALEHPADADGAALPGETLVALHGVAVATSGDAHHWFEHRGERYGHTIDPRDGRPVRHGLASVSVLHPHCMAADALATALTVLGPIAGPRHAECHGIAARFVERVDGGFAERLSPALAAWLP